MFKSIIFCRKSIFQKLYFWRRIVAHKRHISNKKTNTLILPDDILVAHEYRESDYLASDLARKYYDSNYESEISKISQDTEFFKKSILKSLSLEFKKIILSRIHVSKVPDNEIAIVWPEYCNTKILNYYCRYSKNDVNLNISKLYYAINYIFTKLKILALILKVTFFLEYIFFKFGKFDLKKRYKYCIHMDDGLIDWDIVNQHSIVDDSEIKKEDVLFIGDSNINNKWIKKFKSCRYNVLSLKSIFNTLSFREKLDLYRDNSKLRYKLVLLMIKFGFLSSFSNKYLTEKLKWQSFHNTISVNKVISFMIPRSLAEQKMHKEYNIETIFLYFSITEQIIENINDPNIPHCLDYSFMYYDTIISSNISNDWFKTLNNDVETYIDNSPFMCERIGDYSKKRLDYINSLKISTHMKLACILDSPVGLYSVMNLVSYKDFIKTITRLVENTRDTMYLFKTKKPYEEIKRLNDKEIIMILDFLISQENVIYVNELDLSIYEAIGISDLVISAPKSSAIYESLFSKIPTISYRPSSFTSKSPNIYSKINKCEVTNYSELYSLYSYFINSDKELLEKEYMSDIDTILGKYDAKSSISSVRSYIVN